MAGSLSTNYIKDNFVMKCETFVREHLPAIRALLSKELTSQGLTQQEAADKLYLTQPAVAFYKGQARGKKTKELSKIPGVQEKIEELAKKNHGPPGLEGRA